MLQTFVNEKFPKWAKILLCIFGDAAGVYRVLGFVDECLAKKEEKNIPQLVWGILCLVLFPVGLVLGIIDLISIIKSDEFSKIGR